MLGRFIPRDDEFQVLFDQLAAHLVRAARLIDQLFADPANANAHRTAVKDVEHEADDVSHALIERIDKSFITPIDREDIHLLASRLDDVVDNIDSTAWRACILLQGETRQPAQQMTKLLVEATESIQHAVRDLKKPAIVAEHTRAIKVCEDKGDLIYREQIAALFANRTNEPQAVVELLRWKELYESLEHTLDGCHAVANVLQSISFKNS